LAKGFDYVQQIGKTPIVVNDSRGFYTSRVFGTYVMEGAALLKEGVHPRSIEVAGLKSGMPMPPLALHDEVTLSLSLHVMDQTRADYASEGKTYTPHVAEDVIRTLVSTKNRVGKKTGQGYYDYNGREKSLWSGLSELFPLAANQPTQQEIIDRMIFVQANETVRCYEEKVLRSVSDANIGAIFGWGFAPHHGGPLQFLNAYGIEKAVKRLNELADKYGERFRPASVLVEMAKKGQTFVDAA
jgi:3-hydroxyacyl-CoA dehydrogenase/enoyl-CoA hydratase/3-hydroxybutyryl-CoA epimerase